MLVAPTTTARLVSAPPASSSKIQALSRGARLALACYDESVNPEDLRTYAARRWDLVQREKDRWRVERFLAGGPAAMLATSPTLRERARRIHGAPAEARRQADLANHRLLIAKLERAADAFAHH